MKLKDSRFITRTDYVSALETYIDANSDDLHINDFSYNSIVSALASGISSAIALFTTEAQRALNTSFINSSSQTDLDVLSQELVGLSRRGAVGSSVLVSVSPVVVGSVLSKGTKFITSDGKSFTYVGDTVSVVDPIIVVAGYSSSGANSCIGCNEIVSANPSVSGLVFANYSSSMGGYTEETDDEYLGRISAEFSRIGVTHRSNVSRILQDRFPYIDRADCIPTAYSSVVHVLKRDTSDVSDSEKQDIASFLSDRFSLSASVIEVQPMLIITDALYVSVPVNINVNKEVTDKISIATMTYLRPANRLLYFSPAELRDVIEDLYPELHNVKVITLGFDIPQSAVYRPSKIVVTG